ncbi:hypothetical protein Hamer_G008492 [Homarus americanus]|uniref:Uncharacterized protein n=1 Tax=Homarus americanus TaxID=6706 RepID=A0A8J5T6R0_HOMAM|nr:hypothetical protein Hamer_G008492 [Homarus americanus]
MAWEYNQMEAVVIPVMHLGDRRNFVHQRTRGSANRPGLSIRGSRPRRPKGDIRIPAEILADHQDPQQCRSLMRKIGPKHDSGCRSQKQNLQFHSRTDMLMMTEM